jgi:hypothetical protein
MAVKASHPTTRASRPCRPGCVPTRTRERRDQPGPPGRHRSWSARSRRRRAGCPPSPRRGRQRRSRGGRRRPRSAGGRLAVAVWQAARMWSPGRGAERRRWPRCPGGWTSGRGALGPGAGSGWQRAVRPAGGRTATIATTPGPGSKGIHPCPLSTIEGWQPMLPTSLDVNTLVGLAHLGAGQHGPGPRTGQGRPSESPMAAVAQQRPTGREAEADRRQRCDRPGRPW